MKKKLLSLLLALILLATLAPVLATAETAEDDDGPRVTKVQGSPVIFRGGGYQSIPIYRGMTLERGDMILTDKDEAVWITYYGKDIAVSELTLMSIDSLWNRHNRDDSSISLVEGLLKNKIKNYLNENSRNLVRASNSIAGVRGTEYILIYRRMDLPNYADENPYLSIKVLDGKVQIDIFDKDGEKAYIIDPDGVLAVWDNIDGTQIVGDADSTVAATIRDIDTVILEEILESLLDTGLGKGLIDEIMDELKKREEEGEKDRPKKPDPKIIYDSDRDELDDLEEPEERGEPILPNPPPPPPPQDPTPEPTAEPTALPPPPPPPPSSTPDPTAKPKTTPDPTATPDDPTPTPPTNCNDGSGCDCDGKSSSPGCIHKNGGKCDCTESCKNSDGSPCTCGGGHSDHCEPPGGTCLCVRPPCDDCYCEGEKDIDCDHYYDGDFTKCSCQKPSPSPTSSSSP